MRGDGLEKSVAMSCMMDYYGAFLTNKQRNVMELYFNADLSLAEIAQQENISRQGVHDMLKRAENQLVDMEAKLGMMKRYETCRKRLEKARAMLNKKENRYAIAEIDKALAALEES